MSEFKKTLIQIKATALLAGYATHCMLFGGSRSGKTLIALYAIIVRASKTKSRHIILRSTFNSVKTSVWMDTLPKVVSIAFSELVPSWNNRNKSDYCWTLPNGSEIWIGGMDTGERVEKILGKEYSTIFFNETSIINYEDIQIVLTRLAEKNALSKKVYYDCNPPNKKHWSYWLFERKVNPIESEPLEDIKDYDSILMNPYDNLENIDEGYLNILNRLPEKDRDRFLKGLYVEGDDGLAYYSFDPERHIKEVNNKEGSIFIGLDFNVDPMTAVIFRVEDDCIYVFDEIYQRNSDTPKMLTELKKRKYIGDVIPDSTGKNRKTSGKSDFVMIQDAGFKILNTRNPYQVDRVNEVNYMFTNDRVFIDPKCKKLINDLNKVSWKDNKLDQKGKNKMLTHVSDCLGYGIHKLFPIKGNKDVFEYYTRS